MLDARQTTDGLGMLLQALARQVVGTDNDQRRGCRRRDVHLRTDRTNARNQIDQPVDLVGRRVVSIGRRRPFGVAQQRRTLLALACRLRPSSSVMNGMNGCSSL